MRYSIKSLILRDFERLARQGFGDLLDPAKFLAVVGSPILCFKLGFALARFEDAAPTFEEFARTPVAPLRSALLAALRNFFPEPPKKENRAEKRVEPVEKKTVQTRADQWRERAIELAAIAGFSDPSAFSIRQLERAARVKRLEEWNRLAFLRLDLRRLLLKDPPTKFYCDLNPLYSDEERRAIRKTIRENIKKSTPTATPEEVRALLGARLAKESER